MVINGISDSFSALSVEEIPLIYGLYQCVTNQMQGTIIQ